MERTIESLVTELVDAFQEGITLLSYHKHTVAVQELSDTLAEQRDGLRETHQKYRKLAGEHFNLDRQTQNKLVRQLNILSSDVIDALRDSNTNPALETSSIPDPLAATTNYSRLKEQAAKVGSRCRTDLSLFFNRISGWAIPLNSLPPSATPSTLPYATHSDHFQHSADNNTDVQDRPGFKYDKLPTAYSFRLVKILSSMLHVSCTVETFHLFDLLPYQALSYCWGTSTQVATIRCNRKLVTVSQNLEKGLRQLYKYSQKTGRVYFWIDQICINQQDHREKLQQVRLMRAIYQRSMNTIIWIPLNDGIAKAAKSIIVDIWLLVEQRARKSTKEGKKLDEDETKDWKEQKVHDLPPPKDRKWAALTKFLESPWFERCWVVQEVVVSEGSPMIFCGGQQLLWSIFKKAITWLVTYGTEYRTGNMKLISNINRISGRQEWTHAETANVAWDLQDLLLLTGRFRATDPRDRVFALLGLAQETRHVEEWPKELLPDYTRSVRNVYLEVADYCIRKTGTLRILSQIDGSERAENNKDDLETPSWVPRWDKPRVTDSLSAYSTMVTEEGVQVLSELFNRATKNLPICRDTTASPNSIRLKGIHISKVDVCLPIVLLQTSGSSSTLLSSQFGAQISRQLPKLYDMCRTHLTATNTEAFDRRFFVVTTAGLTPEQGDAREEPLNHFHAFLSRARLATTDGRSELFSIDSLRATLKSSLPSLSKSSSTTPSTSSAIDRAGSKLLMYDKARLDDPKSVDPTRYVAALERLVNRRLFITASGHLGLGPASMMSGDMVVVLFGGNVPYVLRSLDSNQWRFIGECYVDGFMRGEALEGEGVGPKDHVWFELI